jgi:hypothetical protein
MPWNDPVPGQLGPGHHIATDSKGNIYIAQTSAGMQKLVFMDGAAQPLTVRVSTRSPGAPRVACPRAHGRSHSCDESAARDNPPVERVILDPVAESRLSE